MKDRLLNRWVQLKGTFWFVPSLMTVAAVALSFATIGIDDAVDWQPSDESPFGYAGQPDGARALMATIAGSTITAAATAFSVTIAVLALASSQFGPRLIRNFVSDRGNQIVLGVFIGTFAYCLLVLRTINATAGEEFVPQVSITIGVGLALASIAVLIYFIHHVAMSIQATSVITSVARELEDSITRLYREAPDAKDGGGAVGQAGEEDLDEDDSGEVLARRNGYIQTIDIDRLVEFAEGRDVVIKLRYHAGQYLLARATVACVWPPDGADEETGRALDSALTLGAARTPTQDVEFAMDQLVEIAVRALSPGVNDPFTALACIDRLGSALVQIVEREPPEQNRRDEDGRVRVIAPYASFGSVADAAFNQIRQYGRGSAAVLIRLLETVAVVARRTEDEDRRDVLMRHAKMIRRAAESLLEENDRADAAERYRDVVRALHRHRQESAAPPESA